MNTCTYNTPAPQLLLVSALLKPGKMPDRAVFQYLLDEGIWNRVHDRFFVSGAPPLPLVGSIFHDKMRKDDGTHHRLGVEIFTAHAHGEEAHRRLAEVQEFVSEFLEALAAESRLSFDPPVWEFHLPRSLQ